MARLAFVAMLLIAFAPAASQVLIKRHDVPQVALQAVEMCTAAGLQTQLVSSLSGDMHGHDAASMPQHHDDDALCEYCSVVMPLPLLLLLLCGLLALSPVAPAFRPRLAVPRLFRNQRSLGAQAPPRLA
ncbi:DUF2946 family protein [Stenotrophomonas mori]|uniref:DUF2946 family protein n=1 Tax=Stenotrophomonas mori TaxID=2871096 RepID=A0ABT0SE43_9GAMM|nr:DUF2946 family protein [Stenotrophomonas mori]MCL7713573.1 DUF2946 family protein [Stenotrophomonas mori]